MSDSSEHSRDEAPIIISGLPRSGTTWMQHYLSRHPRIHIHGQMPKELPWTMFHEWYQTLVEKAEWSEQANQRLDYEVPHYAGCDPDTCTRLFREFVRNYLGGFGPDKPRWGLKYIGLCFQPEAVEQFETLWPETKWIIGMRHPLLSINSLRNTFSPDADVVDYLQAWVATCEFIDQHDPKRVAMFDIDRLTAACPAQRRAVLASVWDCLEETTPVDDTKFLESWEVVHQVRPHAERAMLISETELNQATDQVPGLRVWLERMEYLPRVPH